MIWYVDSINGNNENSGHKITEPLKNLEKFYYTGSSESILKHGDKILIKRGSVFNEESTHHLYTGNASFNTYDSVYLGAYGYGDNPIFTKHKLLNKTNLTSYSDNIYTIDLTSEYITGNPYSNTNIAFLYDKEKDIIYGDRLFNLNNLTENMQFYIDGNSNLYIYCDNFDIIPNQIILPIERNIFTCDANLIIENITFTLGGKHGVVTSEDNGNYNITVKNCVFSKIGGSVQSGQTRYGNGFECYAHGRHISVENCYFEDIYDTGVTYQGQGCTFNDIHYSHNVFHRCSQACENWIDNAQYSGDGYTDCTFDNNLCLLNGYGFGSKNRNNGYGFILSNFQNASYSDLKIYNNTFFKCKDGIYSTVSFDNLDIEFNNNTIYGYENQIINNFYNYTMTNYQDYKNIVKQDVASKFIVLEEDKKGRCEEETLLSSNLYMNDIKNSFLNNYFNSKEITNNITQFTLNPTKMTATMNKCVLIDDMLIFAFIGTATDTISQYSTFASVLIPGYRVTQQTFANPNNTGNRYYSSSSGERLLLQTFYQIAEGAKVELNGVIALTKK